MTEPRVSSVSVDPRISGVVYAGTESGVFRTEDAGHSWSKLGLNVAPVRAITSDPTSSGVVYVAGVTGLFQSLDFGETWRRSGEFTEVNAASTDPQDGRRVYAAGASTVLRSADGGLTWLPPESPLPSQTYWALAVDPTRTNRLYAASRKEVFQSLDAGAAWTPIRVGMPPNVWISSLEVGADGVVYVATEGMGVLSFEPRPDRPRIVKPAHRQLRIVPFRF
jgi:photosystem II stability/assembly factor-like uncharacterized protein